MTVSSGEQRRLTGVRFGLWMSALVCLGLLARWAERLYEHHRAVRLVKSLGGEVRYDYQYSFELNPDGNFDAAATDPNRVRRWLSGLCGDEWFHEVRYVSLNQTRAGDDDLRQLAVFSQLQRLELSGTRVTGAGFASFQNLNRLEYVDLSGTRLTPAGLESLSRNGSIRRLNLWGIDPSQEHVDVVLQFEQLEFVEWDILWGEHVHQAERLQERFPGILIYSP